MRPGEIRIEKGSTLGLSYSGCHDSSVVVAAPDGSITFACALERLSRRKQDGRFPAPLLELLDLSKFSVCALPYYAAAAIPDGPTGQSFHSLAHNAGPQRAQRFPPEFDAQLASLPLPKLFVGHQIAHAASAYYLSGFPGAAVLTYDAGMYNCPWFGGVFRGDGRALTPIEYFPVETNATLASLYAIVTGLLGFSPLKHEGKVTGLAAYGRPDPGCLRVLEELLCERYAELQSAGRWIHAFHTSRVPRFVMDPEAVARLRSRFGSASREQIAASLQELLERHVLEIVRRIDERCPSDSLCLAGGLFANVKLNQRIAEHWPGRVFVAPPMADDGTALGAALAHVYRNGAEELRRTSMFLGPHFAADDIEGVLGREGIRFRRPKDACAELASSLAEGKIVAVFTGASEFGPRALGHRSILARATEPGINATLNRKLGRTEFMPFAPITRIEDAELEYVDCRRALKSGEFMTITFRVSDHMRQSCPAVVHVDGTARPQLVSAESNGFLHDLLTAYHALRGVSSLINTSFNRHEEPIVCTPEDALKTFFEAELDQLFIEGCLTDATENAAAAERYKRLGLERDRTETAQGEADPEVVAYLWSQAHSLEAQLLEKEKTISELRGAAEDRLDLIHRLMRQLGDDVKTGLEARLRVLELERENALRVIQEQEAALHAYRRTRFRERFRPKLGVLCQHPPRPLSVPQSYSGLNAPASAPRISLVTPSYQHGEFLERTLKSVLGQGYPNLEYIVQDGGSSDGTLVVLERYRSRLAHCESARDGGQAAALNLGFRHATGEILAYLNSDDLLLPGALAYVAGFFADHPEVDVVYGHRVIIDVEDREIGRWVLPAHDGGVLLWADYVPQETLFWRRRIWERAGGTIDESFRFAMDWDLLLRFYDQRARFARLPRFLGAFRVHPQQKTSAQMQELGLAEMQRLRLRCHGRKVSEEEIKGHLKSYLLRHVVLHKLYKLGVLRY